MCSRPWIAVASGVNRQASRAKHPVAASRLPDPISLGRARQAMRADGAATSVSVFISASSAKFTKFPLN
jgi:hypothetical protein